MPVPDGYILRPLRPEELQMAAELIMACDIEVSGYSEFTVDDMRSLSKAERVDLSTDSWLILKDEDPVAFGFLWDSRPNEIFHHVGVVLSAHQGRGLGTVLLQAAERRAATRKRGGAVLRTYIDLDNARARQLAEGHGYRFVRRSWSMTADFDAPPPAPSPPSGVALHRGTGSEEDARLMHSLITETFKDHWNHVPRTYEQWRRMLLEREDNDPEMWFFAYEGDEPIGVVLGQIGGREGWIADLGVRAAWRRKGVGEALLRAVFQALYERGIRRVGLAVDTGNETGAVRLYERVGMSPRRGDDEYEKTLT
jgi:mycothiol synthase